MTTTNEEAELRPAPKYPSTLIAGGIGLALLGGVLVGASEDLASVAFFLGAVGGVVGLIGIIGQGVLMGMRAAQYEEYLNRLIEDSDEA